MEYLSSFTTSKQKGYVHTTTRKSDNGGPKRKYYTISDSGLDELTRFKENGNI